MEPLVINYLQTHSLNELFADHGVCARISACKTKVSLNYDQLAVKSGDKLAEECRGLVLRLPKKRWENFSLDDVVGKCLVIARPMDRFYNYGDPNAASINEAECKIYEKLDGTMIALYYDSIKNDWCTATRSVPDADILMTTTFEAQTFGGLFWKTATMVVGNVEDWKQKLDKNVTYVFELTTPQNRVVVRYNEPKIWLIAARYICGHEIGNIASLASQLNVPSPRTLDWPWANVCSLVQQYDPTEFEGCVARDSSANRVKIKNPAWVLASKSKDAIVSSKRNILRSIFASQIDDVLPLLDDETKDNVNAMIANVQAYVRSVDEQFKVLKENATDRKSFAISVSSLNTPHHNVFFQLYLNKNKSAFEYYESLVKSQKLSESTIDSIIAHVSHC